MKILVIKEYEKVETGRIMTGDKFFYPDTNLTTAKVINEVILPHEQHVYDERRLLGWTYWRLADKWIKPLLSSNPDSLINKTI
jgi:hypothetical protein